MHLALLAHFVESSSVGAGVVRPSSYGGAVLVVRFSRSDRSMFFHEMSSCWGPAYPPSNSGCILGRAPRPRFMYRIGRNTSGPIFIRSVTATPTTKKTARFRTVDMSQLVSQAMAVELVIYFAHLFCSRSGLREVCFVSVWHLAREWLHCWLLCDCYTYSWSDHENLKKTTYPIGLRLNCWIWINIFNVFADNFLLLTNKRYVLILYQWQWRSEKFKSVQITTGFINN